MGGQVLGGGVIVLVAVALWMIYLLPSWYSRHQYTSAERNAVRLNQAPRSIVGAILVRTRNPIYTQVTKF